MHVGLHAADLYLTRRARTDWSTFMEYVSGRWDSYNYCLDGLNRILISRFYSHSWLVVRDKFISFASHLRFLEMGYYNLILHFILGSIYFKMGLQYLGYLSVERMGRMIKPIWDIYHICDPFLRLIEAHWLSHIFLTLGTREYHLKMHQPRNFHAFVDFLFWKSDKNSLV